MKIKTIFFIALLFISLDLVAQKLTKRYNMLWDRTEYYNEKNVLVLYSIENNVSGEISYFDANGEMVNPDDYNITNVNTHQRKISKKERILARLNKKYIYDSKGNVIGIEVKEEETQDIGP